MTEPPSDPLPDPLPVLFSDDHLVVVSKPAGMTVHRGKRSSAGETFLLQRLGDQIGRYLYPIHRLDRNTSGILAFALKKKSAAALQRNMATPDARKEYLALARASTPARFVCDRPLTGEHGTKQPACSEFERMAEFSRCSLLRVRITTGRRHQIRRHLDGLAHQIIGDSSYGKGRINKWFRDHYGLPRMFLHAARLAVAHPATGEPLDLRAPLPDDLRAFLTRLPDVDAELIAAL